MRTKMVRILSPLAWRRSWMHHLLPYYAKKTARTNTTGKPGESTREKKRNKQKA